MRFELCLGCGRHIKLAQACPFCGAPPTVGSAPPSLIAIAIAVPLLASVACTSTAPESAANKPTRTAPKPDEMPTPAPLYGGPDTAAPLPTPDELADDMPPPAPAYGGPDMVDPPPEPAPDAKGAADSKTPEGNATAADSSETSGKPDRAKRLYGAPPPRRSKDPVKGLLD